MALEDLPQTSHHSGNGTHRILIFHFLARILLVSSGDQQCPPHSFLAFVSLFLCPGTGYGVPRNLNNSKAGRLLTGNGAAKGSPNVQRPWALTPLSVLLESFPFAKPTPRTLAAPALECATFEVRAAAAAAEERWESLSVARRAEQQRTGRAPSKWPGWQPSGQSPNSLPLNKHPCITYGK